MAEVAATIGLVSSIASLTDLSVKVVSRLHEFTSKTSDIPDSFRSLSIQLPLLTATLERIQTQAQADHFPNDVTKALKAVVDSTSTQARAVQTCLSDTLPLDSAPKLERALKALKSLAREDKIRQALEKIHKNIDVLVLYQTTQHGDTGDRILKELSRLNVVPPVSSVSFGVCLGQAPLITPDAFLGRTTELQQLRDLLLPINHPHRQCIVSIVGMGGMGKTQLGLAHVRDCADDYSSVFWLNAKDETSLRQSMAGMSAMILQGSTASIVQSADDEKLRIDQVRRWLSEPENDQWLLIFDNYDDPCLPEVRSPTGYDIRSFFPTRSQGSILITSRSRRLTFSKQLKLQKLEDFNTSVAILSQRSGRDISEDNDTLALVSRLAGLPLALSTTGSYLGRADVSCGEYLKLYNSAWMDLVGPDTEELLEYEARTMSSTWTLSLSHVRSQNDDAAELLTFLAYLSGQDIWYDLIKAGASDDVPWMRRITQSKIHFQRAMSKLHDYSLVDIVTGSYQVHPCLHDWLVDSLNSPPKPLLFNAALTCIANSIEDKSGPHFWVTNRRLLDHIEELESSKFHDLWQLSTSKEEILDRVGSIARLLHDWDRLENSEQMYLRALAGKEKSLGPDHSSTLDTVNNLGKLYVDQDKLDAAEQMYLRTLAGREKALGPDHSSTLDTVHNLGILYRRQDKLDMAEQMYLRALAGKEKALGPDHSSTLDTVKNFGLLYYDQDKLEAAEQMCLRALAGTEKALGPDHSSTLDTVHNLGLLYCKQDKLDAAEQMYLRALAGMEKALGPDHSSTLNTVDNLGLLYCAQGKPDMAEQMCLRALAGTEKALGPDHSWTLDTVHNLGNLYYDQGKLDAAEHMYLRALAGTEKILGPDHRSTLSTAHNLGSLYHAQGKLDAAEQMYLRVLAGREKALGPDHSSTLDTVHNLGILYRDQGKLDAAEQMYLRVLAGTEKALGPDHSSTLDTLNKLGLLYRAQGKLDEAEQTYLRARAGYEKASLLHTIPALNTIRNLGLLYRSQGKMEEAKNMFQLAASGLEKMLGSHHSDTLKAVNDLRQLEVGVANDERQKAKVEYNPFKKVDRWKNLLRTKISRVSRT